MRSRFFPKGNLIHLIVFLPIIPILYPNSFHQLHPTIKRNMAYNQNYTAKCKRCFAFLTQKSSPAKDKLKASLRSHIYCKLNSKRWFECCSYITRNILSKTNFIKTTWNFQRSSMMAYRSHLKFSFLVIKPCTIVWTFFHK